MNWLEWLPTTFTGFMGLAVVVWGGWVIRPILHRQGQTLGEVHDNTVNTHDTNLRDDIDYLKDMASLNQAQNAQTQKSVVAVRSEVLDIRQNLNDERARSVETDDRILNEITAERKRATGVEQKLQGLIEGLE